MIGNGATEFCLELPADSDAARVARDFVEEHACCLAREVVDDAKLLVSEVVTNAVRYGQPEITLRVSLEPPLIGVSVDDEGDALPTTEVSPPTGSSTSGRGLLIVDSLSSRWGVEPHIPDPGKTVWFRLEPSP